MDSYFSNFLFFLFAAPHALFLPHVIEIMKVKRAYVLKSIIYLQEGYFVSTPI